jgi:hypothetical protein
MNSIFKKSLLWLVLFMGVSVLSFGVQQTPAGLSASQGLGCCQSLNVVNPGLGLLYLAFSVKAHDTAGWRRDIALVLEKRRAKRQARLMGKNVSQRLSPTQKLLKPF